MIGLFNLLPILPFDGGNIVLAGLEVFFPKKSRIVMLYASLAITIGGGLWLLSQPRWGTIAIYAAIFPLMAQLQMLRAREPSNPQRGAAAAALAETAAWRDGDLSRMVPHQVPSPWFRAYQYLHHNDPESARAELLDDFASSAPPRWLPPDAADERTLATLVALLPRPLPTGNPYAEHALADILVRLGEYDTAAHYAADSFRRSASPISALAVARSAAALGDRNTATGWLRAAESLATPAWMNQALLTPRARSPRRGASGRRRSRIALAATDLGGERLRRDQAIRRVDQLLDLRPVGRRGELHHHPTPARKVGGRSETGIGEQRR